MKSILVAGLALCALTNSALAEPARLPDASLDEVNGGFINIVVAPTLNNAIAVNTAIAVAAINSAAAAAAQSVQNQIGGIGIVLPALP